MRYRGVTYLTVGGRIYGFVVTQRDAHTNRGVSVGSPLHKLRQAYPEAACSTIEQGIEPHEYPMCKVEVGAGRSMWLGGDPVRTITLAATSRRGLGS